MAIVQADLVNQILSAANGVIKGDISQLRGFSTDQVNAIAQQSVFVAAGIVDGSISGATQNYFLDSIEEMVRSFVNTLSGMVAVMAEEVWNSVVGAIWTAINTATGLSLKVA